MGKNIDKVLIGSSALEKHLGWEALRAAPGDVDYLAMAPVAQADTINGAGILDKYPFSDSVASLDELYTLKVSHSFWDLGNGTWPKHLAHIKLMRHHGAKLIPELYEIAYKEWETRHGKKKVNLDQDKTEFFNNNVPRIYEHDSIHEAIAFNNKPMFNKILADGEEVKTSREKFEKLSHKEKIQLVQEETMVLSLERDLIPGAELRGKNIDHFQIMESFSKQLKLLVTQYSKGWFPLWIVENYYDLRTPLFNYWECFKDSNKKKLLAK